MNTIDNHIINIVIHPNVEAGCPIGLDMGFGDEFGWIDYTVEIQADDLDGDDDAEPVTIGRAFVYRLNAASANLGDDALVCADEAGDELLDIAQTLRLDKVATEPHLAFPGADRRPVNGDVLHIEGFLIDEEWEGKGIDLIVAEFIIRNLGHGASITMTVDDGPEDGTDPTVREQSTRHWARIGLTPYPTDPYILWHPNGYVRRPQ